MKCAFYRIEIVEDLPNVDVVMVPCGGGGLVGGIAVYLKHHKPSIQVGKECVSHFNPLKTGNPKTDN